MMPAPRTAPGEGYELAELPWSTMSKKKRKASDKQDEDEALILARFLDFQEKGLDEFCRFLKHCGITLEDIDYNGGDIAAAILENYRKPDGGCDLAAAAHDFFRWPPIAARVKELKRERWQKEAAGLGSR
jgi:hypothetical protein